MLFRDKGCIQKLCSWNQFCELGRSRTDL